MENNHKGFTLVELLVAATIIGFLAIVATTSFRNSAAETRWTQAKALTNQLAAAAEALTTERNGVYFSSNTMLNPVGDTVCTLDNMGSRSVPPSQLVVCHFVEQGDWNNEYFQYEVYPTAKNGVPGACVTVNASAKLPAQYKNRAYCLCAGEAGKEGEDGDISC